MATREPDDETAAQGGVEAIYRQARRGLPDSSGPVPAAPAVAVVLWRIRETHMEVFLAQRAASLAFLGGHWAFPGGRIESGDGTGEAGARAAAVREVAEELGVDIGGAGAFVDAGRWVTPAFVPIRFDARYLLVRAPQDAAPDVESSEGELVDGAWVTPGDALERWRRAEWLIPSPVRRVLRALEPGIEGATERCHAEARAEARALRLWEVAPAVAVCPVRTPTLPPATHTNCYLIGADEVVVIDPASPYDDEKAVLDEALEALQDRGARIAEVWLTHHHFDHVGGAAHVSERFGVPIAAHPETAARLPDGFRIERELVDGEVRTLAGEPRRRLRPVFTPGHAPGHMCILEEETGFLVAGDMVAGVGTIVVEPSEGDMRQYLASLERMKTLEPTRLLPAHGMVIADPRAKLDFYLQHRRWREEQVLEALARRGPCRASDLVPDAYADVPPMVHPLAEQSLIAHLVKLEADGHVGREGEAWVAHPVL